MAFPVWDTASATSGNTVANATATTITLPSTRSAGVRLMIWLTLDGGVAATWPAGYTSVFAVLDGSSASVHECRYRDWTGSENAAQGSGGSIQVTHANQMGSWVAAYVQAGTFDTGTAPAQATVTTTSATPDPPSLDPAGWATEDTSWVASCGWDQTAGIRTLSDPDPAGYTVIQNSVGNSSQSTGTAVAFLNNAASSENPGAFTISGTATGVASTVAIRPSSGAPAVVDAPDGRIFRIHWRRRWR